MDARQKPWPCPDCGNNLGYVISGQLLLDGDVRANTDGSNLVVYCKQCGTIKTWYSNDRLSRLIRELADEVAKRVHRIS